MKTPRPTADADEPAFRWPARTLRRTIVFSLGLHALVGIALVLTAAGDVPATSVSAGTTVVSLRHETGATSTAPATRTAGGNAATPATASPPAIVSSSAPTAMRVTPVRAVDTGTAIAPGNDNAADGTQAALQPAGPASTFPRADAATSMAATGTGNPADTSAIDDARRRYLAALGPLLRRHLVYPATAQRRGLEGQALVSVRIARDGSVLTLVVQRSSGEPLLDEAALATVRRAAPLPPLPPGLPEAALDVNVPLSFGLDPRAPQ